MRKNRIKTMCLLYAAMLAVFAAVSGVTSIPVQAAQKTISLKKAQDLSLIHI